MQQLSTRSTATKTGIRRLRGFTALIFFLVLTTTPSSVFASVSRESTSTDIAPMLYGVEASSGVADIVPSSASVPKTSTDPNVYSALTLTQRYFYDAPSMSASRRGNLPAGSLINFHYWTADGSWLYANDGTGRHIYIPGDSIELVPRKTSTDNLRYRAITNTSRYYYSAPSFNAPIRGTLPANCIISFYYWTADGSWLYAGDGAGGLIFFPGGSVETIPKKTSTDQTVYYGIAQTARNYYVAPTTTASVRGSIPANSPVAYRKWTADGTWVYASDAHGRLIYFSGSAITPITVNVSSSAALNYELQLILARVTTPSMTQDQKLFACYMYTVNNFRYASRPTYPAAGWETSYAYNMIKDGAGNCYSFAAVFGYLAKALGYDARIIAGQVRMYNGTWGPHSWVDIYIGGVLYICDPDGQYELGINMYMMAPGNYALVYRR